MERYRVIGSVDNFDGSQNLDEWITMIERAAEFAGWGPEQSFKAAMFRLRGEAGEFAEQLRDEGKLTTWKQLKDALKDRFETVGKEQWHQYLLNTATQGNSTVQEWAQTVRKISLRALGSEATQMKREEEGEPAEQAGREGEVGRQEEAARNERSEARKKLLDYMRKSNFVRGLRSSLRKMVWRKKCTTFDEAVQAAAEEEAVEASHREEEVLSCYKRDLPGLATPGLVDQIVAALEIREEAKRKGQEEAKKEETIKKADPRKMQAETASQNPILESEQGAMGGRREEEEFNTGRSTEIQHHYNGPASGGGYSRSGMQSYGEQLPLPRHGHGGRMPGMRQEWSRQGWNGGRGQGRGSYGNQGEETECYNCGGRGHIRRQCPTPPRPQGNGYRRLQ